MENPWPIIGRRAQPCKERRGNQATHLEAPRPLDQWKNKGVRSAHEHALVAPALSKKGKAVLRFSKVKVFAAMLLLSFLPNMWTGLYEPDEGRYAEVGREMLARGDFLVPHLGGEPHLTKPPFTYWAAALGEYLFGNTVFGARFSVCLANLFLLFLIYRIGKALFDERTGRRASLIFATSLYGFSVGHFLSTDVFVVLWQTLGVFAACEALRHRGRPTRLVFLFWAAFGMAFLTKGPPGLLALVPCLLLLRRADRLRPFLNPAAMAAFLGISLSWYLYIVAKDPDRLRYFLVEEAWQRIASNHHHRENSRWLYVGILTLGATPWFFPMARAWQRLRSWFSAGRPRLSNATWFLAVWLLSSLAIFFLSRSRMLLYLGPIWAGVSVLLGRCLPSPEARPRMGPALQAALIVVWCVVLTLSHHLVKEKKLSGDSRRIAQAVSSHSGGEDLRIINGLSRRVYSLAYLLGEPGFIKARQREMTAPGTAPGTPEEGLLLPGEQCAFIVVRRKDAQPPLEVVAQTRNLALCIMRRATALH